MSKSRMLALAALLACAAAPTLARGPEDPLESGFQNPPAAARPRVWWHWMNGNVTKEGIRLDLEWMKRVGLGGFQNFDASLNTPQVVQKRLVFMTPEWKDAFRYAATLADQLGLEMAIAGSPGWSESGGPWVPPAHAMKKLVWSETRLEGGRRFTGALPKPPATTGPFQNIPLAEFSFGPAAPAAPAQFYADSAVIAYRVPKGDLSMEELRPRVTASGGTIDPGVLADGDLVKSTALPQAPVGQRAWIQFEFTGPQAIHAITLATRRPWDPLAQFRPPGESGQELEASDDGQHFTKVVTVPGGGVEQHTVAFPKVTARFFRVTLATLPAGPDPLAGLGIEGVRLPPPPSTHEITELRLHTGSRVHRFEEKAAFSALPDLYGLPTPSDADDVAVRKRDVIDLTAKMRPDGALDWTPPPGRWSVLRLGYSLTGHKNAPASPEATGLEVDKLNHADVREYFDTYLGKYQDTVGPLMGRRGLQYVVTDSWEAGVQNWTDNMIAEFARRRGYDPRPWLPVLTGQVVESAAASDRFLWDFRKTLADLVAENHYDQLSGLLHRRGMGRYSESHEAGRAFIGDGMEVKRTADVPMSAMWTQTPGVDREQYGYNADIRESASVAHLYGQNLVAAESLTAASGAWAWSPETLKPTADKELAMGLNRFVIHTSVHQPLVDKQPGLGLGPFGQWFTRNETWAEQAKPWIDYLARCSYLLQQGRFAADILYFYGEDSNLTALFGSKSPPIPAGYNFDYVNADALIHRLSVRDGRITTPAGMSYRVLALDPNSRQMSLPVLRKLRDLVKAGVVVVGDRPSGTPSLSDDPAEFRAIVEQLWGRGPGERSVGNGKVIGDKSLAGALAAMNVVPDFTFTKPHADTNLLFVHRRLADGDLYFVDSRNNRPETVEASFRVEGKAAELWHPDTGETEPASYRIAAGRTTVPLRLDPYETVFVVFRHPATERSRTLPQPVETPVATVEGPWEVRFQPERGAPPQITLDRLTSWSENADPGVKYFSGRGTYTKVLQAPQDWFRPGARLWLDLGDVQNLAEISVNGRPLGIAWKPPFRVDLTGALKPGDNTLTIEVTNLWVNRLIGDQQPNAGKKYTFTTQRFYRANSPLLPSGLLGPVRIMRLETVARWAGPSPPQSIARVDALLSKLTLEEKVDLLSGATMFGTRALPRLGIPVFKMTDGPVGAHLPPPSTAMAAGIGLAATWDTALAERVGREIGRDARSRGAHFLLGPGVNIYRAPMNGRNFEYFGEDPFLGARIAVGYINGVQSQGVSATIKHYLGNNSEFARNTSNTVVEERSLREIYLPIFEAAVKDGHVGAIMDSYNLTNGRYMTQNGYLNTEVAKNQWRFPGIIMSDWGATHDALGAANGGLDLEMPFGQFLNRRNLLPAVQEGKVSTATIDEKVRRLLRLAVRFGWLDHEQLDLSIPRYNQPGRQAALDGAREGMVLLKNDANLLPLDRSKVKTIAVIGPDAFPANPTAGGSGNVPPFESVSILAGISNAVGIRGRVTYARGLPTFAQLAQATRFTTEPNGNRRGLTVETFANADLSGRPLSTRLERSVALGRPPDLADVDLSAISPDDFEGFGAPPRPSATRWSGYYAPPAAGTYRVFVQGGGRFRLLVDDRPVIDASKLRKAALNQARLEISAAPHKVVLEQVGGSGLSFGPPFVRMGIFREGSLVPAEAKDLAAKADAVVVAVGFSAETETEGEDREFQLLPGQDELVRAIATANKNTVVVITSGGSVDVTPWIDRIPALIEAWYPGQEGGTALAEVLFGEVNPSGRLPISWERRPEDNPSFGSYYYTEPGSNKIEYKEGIFTGYRGYQHSQVRPLFPFGHGLSYTTFRYSRLSITARSEGPGPGPYYEVAFEVTNTGRRSGAEVPQVYVADNHARVPRPLRELKGFARVELRPGQTRRVTVSLNGRAFTYYDVDGKRWHADPDGFDILVGRSSKQVELKGRLNLPRAIDVPVGR